MKHGTMVVVANALMFAGCSAMDGASGEPVGEESSSLGGISFTVASASGGRAGSSAGTSTTGGRGGAAPCSGPVQVLSLQNGLNGYDGERDNYLVEKAPTMNESSRPIIFAHGDVTGDEASALIRWDLSSLAPSATICSATASLHVARPSRQSYQVSPLLRDWAFDQSSWNQAIITQAWEIAGALGTSDRGSGFATVSGPVNDVSVSFTIPAPIVKGWVSDAPTNHGLIIANRTNGIAIGFASRLATVVDQRPLLTVRYVP